VRFVWYLAVSLTPLVGLTLAFVLGVGQLFSNRTQVSNQRIETLIIEQIDLKNRLNAVTLLPANFEFPEGDIWLSENKSDAEIEAQRQLLKAADSEEIEISRFGSGTRRVDDAFRIELELEGEGKLGGAMRFISSIEARSPRLAIQTLVLRPSQRRDIGDNETLVYLRLQLWGIWRSDS